MSTQVALKALQDAKVLFAYRPTRTRLRARRRLFLTAGAEHQRIDPQSATNMLCGKGYVHAALDRWVLGNRIFGDRKLRHLSDLCPPPPEVWEIRVIEPRPQARLFGRFVEPDTLILTAFHTRDHLGNKGSQAWTYAMQDCVNQWDAFAPALLPFSADSILQYVTENCDDFPIKVCSQSRPGPRNPRPSRIRRR